MNLGRNQLLAWINQVTQCQYITIQMLADGIAFSQIIECLYPGSINIFRLNLFTRYPADCLRNLRILQSSLKRLKINQPASFQKISQGKFQDIINFLQWIYSYTMKIGNDNLQNYQAFNRRLQILQKQGKSIQQINPHLIPNEAIMQFQNKDAYLQSQSNEYEEENTEQMTISQKKQEIAYRTQQLKDDAITMQGQLKTQMETNWKLMHNIQRSIEERNTLYSILKQIEFIVKQSQNSSVGSGILSVVSETPEDFM